MLDAIKQADSVDPTVVKAKIDQPGAQFTYAAINNGIATFGSAASDAVFGCGSRSPSGYQFMAYRYHAEWPGYHRRYYQSEVKLYS